ncbi:MAG: 5-dehydro-2-deoxygluconokinase [Aggregatilineales bacterium]
MTIDLITLGRVSMDLFSLNIGAPFVKIEGFDTGVGGSPINIAIGSSRLGLSTLALTAVGADPVGDFVLNFLQREGVNTDYIPRKSDSRTGMAVLGIEPPDKFPLVFYRENPADIHLSIDEAMRAPIAESRGLLLSGTALSRGACRDATLYAAEIAASADTITFIDLDLRPDQWTHPRAYGLNVRTIMAHADVIIGTEEEFYAAIAPDPDPVMAKTNLTNTMRTELETLVAAFITKYPAKTLVLKRGARGVSIFTEGTVLDVAGFPVEVVNTVGAGDAFASGLITARLGGKNWQTAARYANACGAIVVTRHGCAKAMPTPDEVDAFIENRDS